MKEFVENNDHGTMKERILTEALHLFSDKGYDGTSLQAIADAVGIQKASLIYHFPSKEALRHSVLESLIVYWKTELPRILTVSGDGSDRLISTMTALINFFLEDGNRARLVTREMMDRPREAFSLLKEHFSPWTILITDYLRMGQRSGVYREDMDPDAFIVQVTVMVIGAVSMGSVTSGVVSKTGEMDRGPLIKELMRIIQSALYTSAERP